MIIRKPYAFLIKYFKLIHFVMLVISTVFVFKIRNLYVFFRDYLKTGTYIYVSDMLNQYINMPMIIATIFLVGLLLAIYFLMKQKKKPSIFYLISCSYHIILFIGLIYFQSIFANIEYQNYTNQSLVIFRDFWMILYYFNFYFLIIFFIRAFGFNIKKFNFDKDVKELDISDEDREEIEVRSSFDYEKASNIFRRIRRYSKYYMKENSYILVVFLVVFLLSFLTYFSISKLVINKIYQENQQIIVDDLVYTINNSYVTNKDNNGNIIKNDKCYLVVQFNVLNSGTDGRKISMQNTRFRISSDYYYPLTTTGTKFIDFGIVYKEQYIKANQDNKYILVFEIPIEKNNEIENGILELYNYSTNTGGNVVFHYKDVKLNVSNLEEIDLGTFELMETVGLENTYYESGSLVINKYEILNRDDYKYTKCSDDVLDGKCLEYNTSVVASPGKTLLKIEYSVDFPKQMFANYLSIYYKVGTNFKTINSKDIINKTPDNYPSNYLLILVDELISEADELELLFDIRGVKFKYRLK